MTPESIRRDIEALRAARERLRRRSLDEILEGLARVIECWLAPGSPWLAEAENLLAAHTGFARAMLHEGLPRMLEPLRGDAIGRLLDEELGDRGVIEHGAPALVAHVLPGNVPALAAIATCLTLAVKAAALVKPGAEERWFAPLFAASLAEVDVDLAGCVAVRYWPGGASEIEDEIFAAADLVEVSGGDDAVAAIRARVRGRFVGHGSRLSFAAIGREILADAASLAGAAVAIAEDIAMWNQRGCLSPQVVLVETSSAEGIDSAVEALATALDEVAHRWPLGMPSLEERAALLRFRQAAEWGVAGEPGARLVSGAGGAWTILVERAAQLRPTCLWRTVRLQPAADLAELLPVLAPMRPWLEGVGLAVAPARFETLAPILRAAGVRRVCRTGLMQRPDLGWKPGGMPRLAAWMKEG